MRENVEQEKLDMVLEKVVEKLAIVGETNRYRIPYTVLADGKYNDMSESNISWWTNGFFSGIIWQLFHHTKEERFRRFGRIQEVMLDECFERYNGIDHDIGFMWLHSAMSDYRLTGSEKAKSRAVHAANLLAGRVNIQGGFIRAWGSLDDEKVGWAIIDCMMNLSLLFYATEITGDPRYRQIAEMHANTTMRDFVREDGSVDHIVCFDPETGERLEALAGQGYGVGSRWTRGQSWGIYGFVNAYKHTGNSKYLGVAKGVADNFLAAVEMWGRVPIDFDQPRNDLSEDNSAAAIAAAGLLELSKVLDELNESSEVYYEGALSLLNRLVEKRVSLETSNEAVVLNCAVAYHFERDVETLIYADYFFLEALLKLNNQDFPMW